MKKNIKEKVERLAEICVASSMISLGEDLISEQKSIIDYLKDMNIIEIENWGFSFIDDKYKEIFINAQENF